ncbi:MULTISPECIES: glycoside hydrolase family 2 TIM barrel-domain containing protein [unclassified Mesorhizobium]|uniref:glycoside hydrolase 5 family protein n=2 Tax=Mesorhizobium TaxID=68287 RepID=UPI00167478F6|nr:MULTISPECIES: glycoside hydrolase family 2 TIM barrel-domain containing protein [unclassified Mesorhizobium]
MMAGWQRAKYWLRNVGLCALAFASVLAIAGTLNDPSATSFIKTSGTNFTLDGKPFFVTGVNNHYLTFGSHNEVTRVLDDAVAMGANVARVFLQPVIGSLDGSVPTIWNWRLEGETSNLAVNGTYLLYWDPSQNSMAINDGANGMQKVDFLIAEAGKRHLRLIIAFLDFWAFTGGAQQMRAWYGSDDEATFFFTDPRTKQDYRTWVRHVVERVNPLTRLAYRDDPTIMAWELINEGNAKPEALRLSWTAEMSAYVKSLDSHHLVTSGNANIFDPKVADLTIPTLDFGTWHGYPVYYNLTIEQFNDMIPEFCHLAARANKPVLMEEFGHARSNKNAADAYAMWLDTVTRDRNCAGWMVWRLVSLQDSGHYPVDEHDQFDIHHDGGALWNILKAATARATQTRDTSSASEATHQLP